MATGLESSEQEKQDQDVEPDADPIGCEQEYEAVQGEQGNTDKESPRLGFMSKNAEQNENGYDQEIEEEGDDRDREPEDRAPEAAGHPPHARRARYAAPDSPRERRGSSLRLRRIPSLWSRNVATTRRVDSP